MTNLILALAVWRLSAMLVYEDGPFFVFRKLRKYFRAGEFGGETFDGNRLTQEEVEAAMKGAAERRPFFGELLSCLWCTSIWVAAGVVAVNLVLPILFPLWVLCALSAFAILFDHVLKALKALDR